MATAESLARAHAICSRTCLVDTHIDLPHRLTNGVYEDVSVRTDTGDFDFVRARAGGLDAAFMAVYVPPDLQDTGTAFSYAESLIDTIEQLIAEHPECFGRALSVSDVERNRTAGVLSLPLAIENGAALEGNMANLHHFAVRGVQYITLTHGRSNALCDSSYDDNRQWGGLSPFGCEVIAAMNDLRMMVDVSHASDDAFYQILEASSQPVIATHSSMRHFTPGWERNMTDDMARALADKDGMLMIAFGSSFLSNELRAQSRDARMAREQAVAARGLHPESDDAKRLEASMRARNPLGSVAQVADHVIHAVSLMGIERVGIGSDFDGVYSLPSGLQDVAGYPNLVAELLGRGVAESEIEMLLGGNMLAFWRRIQEADGNEQIAG